MAVQHRIPHDLSHALARDVTRRALDSYQTQFPELKPGGEWLDPDRARVWFSPPGARLEGRLHVHATHIDLELEVPFLFRPFRKQAIRIIEDEVKDWIAKAHAGQLG